MQVMFEDNGIARSEYKFQYEDLNKIYSLKPVCMTQLYII